MILGALALLLLICTNYLSAQTWANDTLTGEDEPLLEGTTWGYVDRSTGFLYSHEFRFGGRFVRKISNFDTSETGTWQREGNIIKIKLNIRNGRLIYYEGKYYDQTQKIMLTGFIANNGGTFDVDTWEPIQGSSIASVPSPQSSVNVQPSAPSQTSTTQTQPQRNTGREIAEAFRSPLQSGTYSLAGTQEKISLAAIAKSGIISQTWQGKTYQGTYNIDGNRMTVQIRGFTFVFTITSETSFSGHGETWVRTGY